MKKRFLPLSMLLITMVLAQASLVANAAGDQGKYTPRSGEKATFSSFMKSIRANQETGLIDPASLIEARKAAQTSSKGATLDWVYAGPDNYGGFTKAMVYDNDGNVIMGTAGGDVYKTTNGGITFKKINGENIEPISSMVMATNGDLYIGTGDGREAQSLNGLSDLGYSSSFVGKGIYVMRAGTTNLQTVAGTTSWAFVNDMVIVNGTIYAATEQGLMEGVNYGESWTKVVDGVFRSVKANEAGVIMAADDNKVYLKRVDGSFENILNGTNGLATNNTNAKIIAMSPTDPNFMYIAYIKGSAGSYSTGNIYFSGDGGDTWQVALASTTLYNILGKNANIDGFMVVYPNNPRKLLIGSDNLFLFEDVTGQGVNSYRPTQISENDTYEFTPIAWNRYIYLHQGIQNIVFNPTNPNVFFVGTVGGIFKGEYYEGLYSYRGGNRYFLTEDEHTSVARMMSVGVGGLPTVLGGCLDHGTIMLSETETTNNPTTGYAVFPNPTATNNAFGYFTKTYAGGPCAISTVSPSIFFVSATGSLSMPIQRSETAGDDYDLSKFSAEGVITNSNAFRTPFALYETYTDDNHSVEIYDILESYNKPVDTTQVSTDTITLNDSVFITTGQIFYYMGFPIYGYDSLRPWPDSYINIGDTLYKLGFTSEDTLLYIYNVLHNVLDTTYINFDTLYLAVKGHPKADDVCHYYSNQAGYPIDYTMPEPPHDSAHMDPAGGYYWIPGDTITGLHDPIRSTMVCGISGKVYMTRDALIFNKNTNWFLLSNITGLPTAVTMSADGTTAYVGTDGGNFYKFTHIDQAFTAEQAKVADTLNPCVEMYSDLSTFNGRAITSISVNPSNANEVVVTLGNYDNSVYVYRSINAGASFTAAQGDLQPFPVYSSIIEKESGLYIIGTEFGIYTSDDHGATWTKSGNFTCPVMDLKQAIVENHDDKFDIITDDGGNATTVVYPGVYNEGMIYAATYGCGIISCGNYKVGPEFGLDENDVEDSFTQVNVYPNPASGNAQFTFNMNANGNASYQIYDIAGRMVVNRNLGFYTEGEHTVSFNVEELAHGTYIIRLQAGDKVNTAKFLVY